MWSPTYWPLISYLISSSEFLKASVEYVDPLPFPASVRFNFTEQPESVDSFTVASVYMTIAYSQYIAAVVRPIVPDQGPLGAWRLIFTDHSGYAGPTDLQPVLDVNVFMRDSSVSNHNHMIIWLLEGLLDGLRPFKDFIKSHGFTFSNPDLVYNILGVLAKIMRTHEVKPLPSLEGVDVSFSPQAQPLDMPDTIFAAQKIFKRVMVEELDAVVPRNWQFSSGGVTFTFITPPGIQPRTMTWAELGRGAMAMIDFMRKHGEEGKFKEVRAAIQRRNAAGALGTIGLADVTVNANGKQAGDTSAVVTA